MSVCEAAAAAVYCLAETVAFHAEQAIHHAEKSPQKEAIVSPADCRESSALDSSKSTSSIRVGARWTFFSFRPPFSWRFFGRATAGGATRSPKHAEPTPPLAVVLREENKLSEAEKNQAGVIIDRVQYALRASKVTSAASRCSVGTLPPPPPPLPPPPPAQLRRRPTAGGLSRPTLGKKRRGLMRSERAPVA